MPDIDDLESTEDIKVTVSDLNSTFMTYSEELSQIQFFGLNQSYVGNYSISVTM